MNNSYYELSNDKDLKNLRNKLIEILPDEPIFVCIGTPKIGYDSFGPIIGSKLKEMGYKVYGTKEDSMNGLRIDEFIKRMKKDGIEINDPRIVAIDACLTKNKKNLFKAGIRNKGIKPGAGIGKNFPLIGKQSLVFITGTIGSSHFDMMERGADYLMCIAAAELCATQIKKSEEEKVALTKLIKLNYKYIL